VTDQLHQSGQPIKRPKMKTQIRPIRGQIPANMIDKCGKLVGQLGHVTVCLQWWLKSGQRDITKYRNHFNQL